MIINLTNHPSNIWNKEQHKDVSSKYGKIIDMPFPRIEPFWENEDKKICDLVREYRDKIVAMNPDAVFLMGEWKFTIMLVNELLKQKIKVLCSAIDRDVTTTKNPDGSTNRVSVIRYNHLREYSYLGDKI